ncbi:MAG: hypothetical protein M3440_12440 [Chloroflexota bacterium]|nr:hypothetical protein [Chloroflexota bacterium]
MSEHDHQQGQALRDDDAGLEQIFQQSRRFGRWHLIAWSVVTIGLMIWLATGRLPTTTYAYNPFTEITLRYVTDVSLQHIWAYQAQHLPTVQYQSLLDGAFVVSVAVVVLCVIGGTWLLLVTASDSSLPDAGRKRRSSFLKQSP